MGIRENIKKLTEEDAQKKIAEEQKKQMEEAGGVLITPKGAELTPHD